MTTATKAAPVRLAEAQAGDTVIYSYRTGRHVAAAVVLQRKRVGKATAKRIEVHGDLFDRATGDPVARSSARLLDPTAETVAELDRQEAQRAAEDAERTRRAAEQATQDAEDAAAFVAWVKAAEAAAVIDLIGRGDAAEFFRRVQRRARDRG